MNRSSLKIKKIFGAVAINKDVIGFHLRDAFNKFPDNKNNVKLPEIKKVCIKTTLWMKQCIP